MGKNEKQRNLEAWISFVAFVEEDVRDSECAYPIELGDDLQLSLLTTLADAGIVLPQQPPKFVFDGKCDEDNFFEELYGTKEYKLIFRYVACYMRVLGWFELFMRQMHDNQSDAIENSLMEIEFCLLRWALNEITEDLLSEIQYDDAQLKKEIEEVKLQLKKELNKLCMALVRENKPIMTDYFNLINESAEWLDGECLMFLLDNTVNKYLPYGQKQIKALLEEMLEENK